MTAKKSRSEKVVNEGVEVPYPVVPSKKEKDHHQAKSAIREVTIAKEKWATRSHALSARPGAKRPGTFSNF